MKLCRTSLVALVALLAASACGGDSEDDVSCFGANCTQSGNPSQPGGDSGLAGPGPAIDSGTTLPPALGGGAAGGTSNDAGGSLPGALGGGTTGGAIGGLLGGRFDAGGLIGGRFDAGGLPGGSGLPGGGTLGGGTPDAGAGGGDASTLPPTTGGTEPKIPEVSGTCPEFKNGTVMVAGHRGVALQVGAAGKNGALLFYWHGTGSSASEVNGGFIGGVPAAVRNEILQSGGIIASFNGSQSSGAEGDCSGTGAHNMADFKAADQIVACAVKNHGIDPRRIYTTGCSAGGLQSGCFAQVRSSYVAAAAPNSGGVVFPQRWQDAGKPAIFTMHGGSSDWVIVTFSETSKTLDMSAKQHGSFVVNCDHGGGHCAAPDALKTASWKFMKDHPYGADSPWKSGIPSGVPNYCKIF